MSKLKIISILTIAITFVLPLSTVFADHEQGLLYGKPFTNGTNEIYEITDGDHSTYFDLNNNAITFDFGTDIQIEALSYYIDMGTSLEVMVEANFYNDGVLVRTFNIDNSKNDTEQIFHSSIKADKIILRRVNGATYKRLFEFEVYGQEVEELPDRDGDGVPDDIDPDPDDPNVSEPDTIPPTDVSNISVLVSSSSIKLLYDLPLDDDFSHLQIYRDGFLIADNITTMSYTDSGLEPSKKYTYVVKSVDKSGNISNGSIISATTSDENDLIPPDKPSGLNVTSKNSGLAVTWNHNNELDLDGYNIYVNGNKHNTTVIKGNTYNIYGLENGRTYDIEVSAVDTSGNESALSTVVTSTPEESGMPFFKMDYSLKDVSDSVGNWFSEVWLILAFATSIPLTFYIANRVKSLFIA